MNSKSLAGLISGLLVVSVAGSAYASGYLLYEASPKGVAQGGAMIADGSEAASLFYNPAGLARLSGFNAQASLVAYYAGGASFRSSVTGIKASAEPALFPMPTFFASYKFGELLSFGIGGYSAYGLGLSWPEGWAGYSQVKKANLTSYQLQPSFAVGPWKGFSAGAGVDILFGSVDITRGIPFTDGRYGEVRIAGSASAVGFNAGLFYEPSAWLRLGATFRSAIKISLKDGSADFTVPAAFQETLRDQSVTTSLTSPPIIGLGARFKPLKSLEAELDAAYVGWSVYDTLDFHFETPALNQMPQVKNWKDSFQLRAGGQYDIDALSHFRQEPKSGQNVRPAST
jgi:long-chain fatty acid transport protein